jgi:hypothetical protein
MSWVLRKKGTDWTGKPIKPIHTAVCASADSAAVPIALVHTETEQGKKNANIICAAMKMKLALQEVTVAFRDGGTHLERVAALMLAEEALRNSRGEP